MSGDKTHPLDPCPFCGNNEVPRICQTLGSCVDVCCVAAVGGCGASTGHHKTEAEAIAAWNRRTPTLAPQGLPPAGLREAVAAVEAEPELPGPMPDEMYAALQGDRDACAEACRIIVRQTKAGIKSRILGLAAERERGGG